MRWTKRPQNFCASCGYAWFPKGKGRSAKCPRCGGAEVRLMLEGCLDAVVSLILLPLLPFILVARVLLALATAVLHVLAILLGFAGKGLIRVAPSVGSKIGAGSAGVARLAARSFPGVKGAVGGMASRLGAGCYAAAKFGVKWVASAKDDLQGDADREVNPVSLIAKLSVFTMASSALIIAVINLSLFVSSSLRSR